MNNPFVTDVDEGEEAALRLPALELGTVDLDSKTSRKEFMAELDDLLEWLERTNLNDLRHPPWGVVRRLIEAGLPNPLSYSVPQLIEIVFNTQWPIMRANPDGYSLL